MCSYANSAAIPQKSRPGSFGITWNTHFESPFMFSLHMEVQKRFAFESLFILWEYWVSFRSITVYSEMILWPLGTYGSWVIVLYLSLCLFNLISENVLSLIILQFNWCFLHLSLMSNMYLKINPNTAFDIT